MAQLPGAERAARGNASAETQVAPEAHPTEAEGATLRVPLPFERSAGYEVTRRENGSLRGAVRRRRREQET